MCKFRITLTNTTKYQIFLFFRWLQPPNNACLTATENRVQPCIYMNWSRDVKGPIGNGGGGQENQSYFDDASWHKSRELTSSGYVVYHKDYVNAIVPLVGSVAGGTAEGKTKELVFYQSQ